MSRCYDNPDYDDSESDIQNTWNQHPKVEQKHETKVMKNLHILQTDKPSRLAYDFDKLILNSRLLSPILYKTQNIYITSDEKIKEGDWYFDGTDLIHKKTKYNDALVDGNKNAKKIILTTDQDLIGVQAIDDEFLEWFVKNPNCEEVEANKSYSGTYYIAFPYKIIIPKEGHEIYTQDDYFNDEFPKEEPKYPIGGYAPGNYMCNCSTCKTQFQGDKRAVQCEPCAIKMVQKQNIIDTMKGDEELGLYDEIQPEQIWNKEKMEGIKQLIQDNKKETLEEAAERLVKETTLYGSQQANIGSNARSYFETELRCVLMGMKYQQERSYSDEDVLEMMRITRRNEDWTVSQLFEQFKKK